MIIALLKNWFIGARILLYHSGKAAWESPFVGCKRVVLVVRLVVFIKKH